MDKEVRQLLRTIEHIDGVEIRTNGKGHHGVYYRGKYVTSISSTPSDPRWRDNVLAELRRGGITPSNKPMRPAKDPTPMLTVDEIRARLPKDQLTEFVRFLTDDLPKLQPGLRGYKNAASAHASLRMLADGQTKTLHPWSHTLLDAAIRSWDNLQAKVHAAAQAAALVRAVDKPRPTGTRPAVIDAAYGSLPAATNPAFGELDGDTDSWEQIRLGYARVLLAQLEANGADPAVMDRLDRLMRVTS